MKYWVLGKKILGRLRNTLRILTENRASLTTQNPATFAPESLSKAPVLWTLSTAGNFCRQLHRTGRDHLIGQGQVTPVSRSREGRDLFPSLASVGDHGPPSR